LSGEFSLLSSTKAFLIGVLLSTVPAIAQVPISNKAAVQQIHSAADETSPILGILEVAESVSPVAETLGAGGVKWHLIKTKSGLVGWIKRSDSAHSTKLDSFFKSHRDENPTAPISIPLTAASAAPSGAIMVPVQFARRAAIVPAVLNRRVSANLILDTGATSTVISRRLANLLSMRPTGTTMGQTVGGTITAPIARLASLKVGAAEIAELSVIVHDFTRDARVDGLLGMDFLGQYRVGLDSKRHLLVLSPR
jgi:hypothetical protein